MAATIEQIRNIGISAHIDAGKTTLTERILFYTNRIHTIHDVKGKDGVGATMDFMELEKERGITIASAATCAQWNGNEINIIDTPGHVDFTIEVERSLRVLDSGVLVLCAVGGVQSQSITVDQQMARYKVPCIAFINKCDRSGADPLRVARQLKEKLNHNAVLMQLPVGLEADFSGIIDLVSMQAMYFEGERGEIFRTAEIPDEYLSQAQEYHEQLLDNLSMFDDELTEAMLEDQVSEEVIIRAIRRATINRHITPVFMGSAYKNKGVQPLLNAICRYAPGPHEVENIALDITQEEKEIALTCNPQDPIVSYAFKLEDGPYGQLTYIRVYQGSIKKGDTIHNIRTGKKVKVGRLVRMHANQMEDIEELSAGNIGALFGIDCASGDTFVAGDINVTLTSMYVPEPVISLAVKPIDNKARINMSKALNRFTKEDPTFRTHSDEETGETIISGMGELHLEVYIERMRREYKAAVETGAPQVSYRETITQTANFNYTHKKQTGGSGQFGRIAGYIEPFTEEDFSFESKIVGGAIPTQFIPACEKGFRSCTAKGNLISSPVIHVKVVINDGAAHSVDSSDIAFQTAARGAFLEAYRKASPIILEPIMKVAVETPPEFQGPVMGSLNSRRGIIIGTQEDGTMSVIEAQVPLAEMFGYSTTLRSLTQGKAQFTMEFDIYKPVPKSIGDELIKQSKEKVA